MVVSMIDPTVWRQAREGSCPLMRIRVSSPQGRLGRTGGRLLPSPTPRAGLGGGLESVVEFVGHELSIGRISGKAHHPEAIKSVRNATGQVPPAARSMATRGSSPVRAHTIATAGSVKGLS